MEMPDGEIRVQGRIMKIEKLLKSFEDRLREVFGDDLKEEGWKLLHADKYQGQDETLKEVYFIFSSKSGDELTLTVNHGIKMPVVHLKKQGGSAGEFGLKSDEILRSSDGIDSANDVALNQLGDMPKSVFKRILRYISLKIDEFVY